MKNTYSTINADNVDKLDLYNSARLCTLTGYANAPAAIKALDLKLGVKLDQNGNIASVHSVDAETQIYS